MTTAVVLTTAVITEYHDDMSHHHSPSSPLGDRELELLRWVAERGPTTVGEAAEAFAAERGLARTTVQTMLERLRRKGLLGRRRTAGVFRYSSPVPAAELLRRRIRSFVEGSLGGSLSPFVAYLADLEDVDEAELAELRDLVDRLEERRRDEP